MRLPLKKTPELRRRRQRTGLRAPLTTYYRSEKPDPDSSPFKKRTPKKNRRKLFVRSVDVLMIAALIFLFAYGLVLQPDPKVIINSNAFHSTAQYKAQAVPQLGTLRNRNKITFDEQGTVRALQSSFPEISTAQIELPFFSETPTIRLYIATPSFKLTNSTGVYIVDSDGVIAAKAADLPKLSKLQTVTDQSGFETSVGKRVLSAQSVGFINTVIAQCERAGVPLSNLTLPAIAQQVDVRTADQPYYTKFYLGGDALLQSGQFLAARHQFAVNHQTPSQYLDVRVSGKIFYK